LAVRDSKRALGQAAELLGTDTVAARDYLRRVQRIVGPISYTTIVEAMRNADGYSVETVAARLRGEPARPDE
jgi:hypothetical protein